MLIGSHLTQIEREITLISLFDREWQKNFFIWKLESFWFKTLMWKLFIFRYSRIGFKEYLLHEIEVELSNNLFWRHIWRLISVISMYLLRHKIAPSNFPIRASIIIDRQTILHFRLCLVGWTFVFVFYFKRNYLKI